MARKLTIEEVREPFKSKGCELLEDEYINNETKMRYRCVCKRSAYTKFTNFQSGSRCMDCRSEAQSKRVLLDYDFVKSEFEKAGCKLLEPEYTGAHALLRYICKCGDESRISFSHFQKGQRCRFCCIETISGENCRFWNPNLTDEDRLIGRNFDEYRNWRRTVYKRDNFTCQCRRLKGKKINAHHIYNWADHRDKRLDASNGITLCEDCHISFHFIYGRTNTNQEQLNEFLPNIKNT